MYKRLGIELRQPTIEGWFHGVADLMRPMYYRLRDYMLALDYLQSDESTVPVVDSEKRRAVKGYMWLARSVIEPLVLFHYHEGHGPRRSYSSSSGISRARCRSTGMRRTTSSTSLTG